MDTLITKKETDQLKGLAILMIMVQHLSQSFGISIANPLGPIGVCLFLFLSGFGLTFSFMKNGRKGYVSKRLLKVYLPYLLTLILFLAWQWISRGRITNWMSILRYSALVDFFQGSYWYLAMIIFWYIAFYFLTFIIDRRKPLLVLSLCCSLCIVLLMRGNRLFVWQFFSFPAGIFCQLYQERIALWIKKENKFLLIIMAVIVVVCMILKKTSYVETHELGAVDTALQMIITIDATILVLIINRSLRNVSAYCVASAFIGSISYELYLAHTLPLDSLNGTMVNLLVYLGVVAVVLLILLGERSLQNRILHKK